MLDPDFWRRDRTLIQVCAGISYFPSFFGANQRTVQPTSVSQTEKQSSAAQSATSATNSDKNSKTESNSNSNSNSQTGSAAASSGQSGSQSGSRTGSAAQSTITSGSGTGRKGNTTGIAIDPRLPPGGVSMITPAATDGMTFVKVGDYVTFIWNYTRYVSCQPFLYYC